MIARVVYTEVEVEGDRRQAAIANLTESVVPELRKQPGFVAAYWTNDEKGSGLAMIIWNDEQSEAANEAHIGPRREQMMAQYGVRLIKTETRRVIAHS